MRFTILPFCFLLTAVLTMPQASFAQQSKTAEKLLGTFGAWKAYTYDEKKDEPVCYMTLTAHFPPDKKLKRGDAYLMITHRPAENSKDVVSYAAGYNFKTTSDVDVVVGKKTFNLFTQKDTAWSRDATTDHALAAAIRDGAKLKLTGTPAAKGAVAVIDTIDLKGGGAAYAAIGKACGYPDEKPKAAPVQKKKPAQH